MWVPSVIVSLLACQSSSTELVANVAPAAVAAEVAAARPADRPYRNVLLVIVDDYGLDAAACYSRPATSRAPQPSIESLCRRGVVFDNAWASPYCSPTRVGVLTGRLGSRMGVGTAIGPGTKGPSLDEYMLPQAIEDAGTGYATAHFGKWHLSDPENGGADHPNLVGFDHYAGNLGGEVDDYYSWDRTENGVRLPVTDYATTRNVDDALEWITAQEGPWFAQLGFNAGHTPLHLPPSDLHSFSELTGTEEDIDANPLDYYHAMIEAMDTELGRLIDGLGDEARASTMIILIGDNGTHTDLSQDAYPSGHGKGTLYDPGIRVPLIIAGGDFAPRGRHVPFIVQTLDLFSTVIQLTDGRVEDLVPSGTELDSVSLMPYLVDDRAEPQRQFVIAERFGGRLATNGEGQAISNGRYKLHKMGSGAELFFDLVVDPLQENELSIDDMTNPDALNIYQDMLNELAEHPLPASTGGDTGSTGGDTGSTGGDTGSTGGDTGYEGGDTGG